MQNQGMAHMGTGRGSGENRTVDAVKQAIQSPLLETTIEGARGVLLNFTGDSSLGGDEIDEAAELVQNSVNPDANIMWGISVDDSLDGDVIVTLIATGFDKEPGAKDTTIGRAWPTANTEPVTNSDPSDLDIPPFIKRIKK